MIIRAHISVFIETLKEEKNTYLRLGDLCKHQGVLLAISMATKVLPLLVGAQMMVFLPSKADAANSF